MSASKNEIHFKRMIVDEWLNAEFEGGRHRRRIDMIAEIEQTQALSAAMETENMSLLR